MVPYLAEKTSMMRNSATPAVVKRKTSHSLFITSPSAQRAAIHRCHDWRRDAELVRIKEQQLPSAGHFVGIDEDFLTPR
jgi:hypothetical protein